MPTTKPPLLAYDALAIAMTSAFIVSLCLLAAEVLSITLQTTVPPVQRLLRWLGRDPPAWLQEWLTIADLLEELVTACLYRIWDRFDPPLYDALRWLWRRLHLDWAIEVALLVSDIISALPAEAWRRFTTGGTIESKVQPTDQHSGHLSAGRSIDDSSRFGDRSEPNA